MHSVYGSKVATFNVIGSRQTESVIENETADDAIKTIPLVLITTEATGHKLIYIALTLCKHACKVDCDVKSGIDPLPF